ncbi:MAG: hypothetical protein ABIL69_11425 [candidate division WOR-3 bacterium]
MKRLIDFLVCVCIINIMCTKEKQSTEIEGSYTEDTTEVLAAPAPPTYYFIKTFTCGDTTIAEIIEITTNPDSLYQPEGYSQVTLTELHNMGYLSPSESEVEAKKQGTWQGEDIRGGLHVASWIYTEYVFNYTFKRVYCSSKTYRDWNCPGPCYVSDKTYRDWYNLVHSCPQNGMWCYNWGWAKTCSYSVMYPSSATFRWDQLGIHKFSSGGTYYNTHAYKTW